jgi:hypothetical protein
MVTLEIFLDKMDSADYTQALQASRYLVVHKGTSTVHITAPLFTSTVLNTHIHLNLLEFVAKEFF